MNNGLRLSLLAGLLALPLLAPTAEAQRNAGRNGAAFLKVGVGAREVAMGSAVSSISNDANQIFWNPAGTALRDDQTLSASFSYGSWIGDIGYTAAAVGYNLGSYGTISAGVQAFGVSDIPANRQNGYDDPILQGQVTDTGTSDTYGFQDLALSVAYAHRFNDRLSLGATAKLVNESIDDVSATAVGFDFGSVYDIGVNGWKISARLNNLGSDMTFYNQSNPLPLNFSIGTSIYPVNTEALRVMVALDATKQQDTQQLIFGGTEVSFYDLLFLRGGYKFNYSGTSDGGTADREAIDTTIENYSIGGGIQYAISGNPVGVDYAFTSMDLLDNVHRISLRIGF